MSCSPDITQSGLFPQKHTKDTRVPYRKNHRHADSGAYRMHAALNDAIIPQLLLVLFLRPNASTSV